MNRVLEVDADARVAWVEPGVLNLDLTRAVVAPRACTTRPIRRRSRPARSAATSPPTPAARTASPSGVTSAHVLAVDVVLADGAVARLGGLEPDTPGYDLRGCFVGSEGTMGIATRIAVRLTPDPPAVATMLLAFDSIDAAAATVSGTIAGGVLPAALEMMDARITARGRGLRRRGLPARRARRCCSSRSTGSPAVSPRRSTRCARSRRAHGAVSVRVAADDAERALLWKGRKSAFGAIARIAPDYYLHDAVVPRTRLVEVLRQVYEIADAHELITMNVFHAGDGNLHPLIVFDRREPGVWERVHDAGQRDPHDVHRRRAAC